MSSLRESIRGLLKNSGLFSPVQLEEMHAACGGDAPVQKLVEFAAERHWINDWQARQLLSGRREFRLGRYLLVGTLGEGGMGTVFLAEEVAGTTAADNGPSQARKKFALKLMAPRLPIDDKSSKRFLREVKAGAALHHPNIVSTLEADQAGAKQFLVMEYVAGKDLGAWLRKHGPLPVGWACECIRQAALGLQHAFEHGLVHRDLKPENILVVAEDLGAPPLAKLLDLGLAKFVDEGQGTQLTSSGQIIGTIDYMSPEQVEDSKKADIRSDIYSLGSTLFKLLSGHLPFPGKSVAERLHARRSAAPRRLSAFRDDIPPGLEAIVVKATDPDPAKRYRFPRELADALKPFTTIDPAATVRIKEDRGLEEGSLTDFFLSDVPGAESLLDGLPGRRTDPWRPLREFAARRWWIVLAAAAGAALGWYLLPRTGTLLLEVRPAAAVLYVDGRPVELDAPGPDEAIRIPLPAGARAIELSKSGYRTHAEQVAVPGGGEVRRRVELVPVAPAP